MGGFLVFKLGIAYMGAALTALIVGQLVMFVSYLPTQQATPIPEDGTKEGTAWVALHNISLLCCFMFVHSALTDSSVKGFFERRGLQDVERSVYVILSCIALQFLFSYWQPMPWLILWDFDIVSYRWLWWMYTVLHIYVWFLIYLTNLMLDVPELLGIKQVTYCNRNLQSPDSYKSTSFQCLRKHMNHTSFLGFSLLFWVYPYMRLDRAIFAILLQLYMIINWNSQAHDVDYVRQRFEEKKYDVK